MVLTGDSVHDGLFTLDWDTLVHGPTNAFRVARDTISQLKMPAAIAMGNHDAPQIDCDHPKRSTPRQLSEDLYRHFFGAEPYSALRIGGWKVLVMNSMLGHTWDERHPECNTRLSSYGRRQLDWAAGHLSEGLPTIVAMHHPLPTSARGEAPKAIWHDIVSLLSAHPNVQLVVSGHYHKGYDWGGLYPFAHRTLPALRYSDENFLLLDLHPNGTWDMPDWPKNKGGSRCSHTWKYRRGAEPGDADAPGSDCGLPLAEDTESYELPPIASAADIPASFNPELACSFSLAKQVLAPCLAQPLDTPRAREACCSVVIDEFQHGSDRPFDGCLCQPGFWEAAVNAFAAVSLDLTKVIQSCPSNRRPNFYRGAGACPPPPGDAGAERPGGAGAAADAAAAWELPGAMPAGQARRPEPLKGRATEARED